MFYLRTHEHVYNYRYLGNQNPRIERHPIANTTIVYLRGWPSGVEVLPPKNILAGFDLLYFPQLFTPIAYLLCTPLKIYDTPRDTIGLK